MLQPGDSVRRQASPRDSRDSSLDRLPTYSLMVAGSRSAKTSFLRLLLDTSEISPSASTDQLASLAKFVHGCAGHTSHLRSTSIDILGGDTLGPASPQRITLNLTDTPSVDFREPEQAERIVDDILRHVEARFLEALDDEHKPQSGGNLVHLCLYFLDPDHIVPPSAPVLPAPPVHRAGAFAQSDGEPVILEPPVVSKPLPANLPREEIDAIHKLSYRVNVLPVIARADTLSNDRLAAVKLAVRKDLADNGIGFGIFDMTPDHLYNVPIQTSHQHLLNGDSPSSRPLHQNGSISNGHSPPASPATPLLLRLPYALISPDMYSHSDGVPRLQPSRHEIINQYTPHRNSAPRIAKGIYLRSYRWGSLDVLDSNHSDFLPLRSAIFHHMEALQKYTREYLLDKFRAENISRPAVSQHSLAHITSGANLSRNQLPPLSHPTRPVLAIDTVPHPNQSSRHHSISLSHGSSLPVPDLRTPIQPRAQQIQQPAVEPSAASRASKQRTKKIPVACNFCRSRKLKCDGGRPACGQCVKRSNPCDYMPQNRRRNNRNNRKDDESESDSGEDRSGDVDEASLSPEVISQPLSRRSSNVDKYKNERDQILMPLSTSTSSGSAPARGLEHPLPHSQLWDNEDTKIKLNGRPRTSSTSRPSYSQEPQPCDGPPRTLFPDYELPQIVTMSSIAVSTTETSPLTPMSAPTLPALRAPPNSDPQSAQRKRAATVPGKAPRQPSTSGPKVVACNFCRARKTKCDGAHPACSSCARRSLQCNYAHDSHQARKGRRASAASKASPPESGGEPSNPAPLLHNQHHCTSQPPSHQPHPHRHTPPHSGPAHPHSHSHPTPSVKDEYAHHPRELSYPPPRPSSSHHNGHPHDVVLKRSLNELEMNPGPLKKSRMDMDVFPSVSSLA